MKALIIANARWTPGMSGGDNIYINFKKYWPADVEVWEMLEIDFKPFFLCYAWRIILSCWRALICKKKYDFVYSASDFLMDSLPALIMKWKGNKWVAGFYLYAPRSKVIYYLTQGIAYWCIKWFADIVCVTNGSMVHGFADKKTIEVNGGVDLTLAGPGMPYKIYDAVFCGRIHPSKGIDELLEIWKLVRKAKPDAILALIGDGDLGTEYIVDKLGRCSLAAAFIDHGINICGHLDDERFDIYKKSKVVLYPSKWDHFSMSPVEAMACGCPMIAFDLPVMKYIHPKGTISHETIKGFANSVIDIIKMEGREDPFYTCLQEGAVKWANTWDWKITTRKVFEGIVNGL